MGKWLSKGVYGVLGLLGLGMAVMVGMTVIDTALVSHYATANQSSVGFSSTVGEHSSVGDHSNPDNHADLIINHSAGAFNSSISASCSSPSGTQYWNGHYSWGQERSIYINFSRALPVGSTCYISETIDGNYWDFDIFTDTDSDPTLVPGGSRTVELHAGYNYVTLSHQYDPLPRVAIDVNVTFTGDPPPTGEQFRLDYSCYYLSTQTADFSILVTGTTWKITDHAVGEKCYIAVSPTGSSSSNWTGSSQTTVDIQAGDDIQVPFTLEYFDPALHGLSYLKIVVEVDAPESADDRMQVEYRCDSNGQGPTGFIGFPLYFNDGIAIVEIDPTRHVSTCNVEAYLQSGLEELWDRRVDGECGKQKNVAIHADQTSTVTFSNKWVEPYVAQCPTDTPS